MKKIYQVKIDFTEMSWLKVMYQKEFREDIGSNDYCRRPTINFYQEVTFIVFKSGCLRINLERDILLDQ